MHMNHWLLDRPISSLKIYQVALTLILLGFSARELAAKDAFLQGLLERRLYELAVKHLEQSLTEDRDLREQTEIVNALIRTLTEQAVHSAASDRQPLLERAHAIARQFQETQRGKNPRLILVQIQDALSYQAEGELLRIEAAVAAQRETANAQALEVIRQAARNLEQIAKDLQREIPLAGRGNDVELSQDELYSLLNQVNVQLARAYRNRALCYPEDSTDRVAALNQAIQRLDETLKQLAQTDPLVAQLYLDQATCFRMLKKWNDSQRLLTALSRADVAKDIKDLAEVEVIRLAIDTNNLDTAGQLLERLPATDRIAEQAFARLEVYLRRWTEANRQNNEPEADRFQTLALSGVKSIEERFGAYWGRRAELALLKVAGKSATGNNLAILKRTGDDFYLKGKYAEAVSAYEDAAAQANSAEQSFELRFLAAQVLQAQKQFLAAANKMRQLAQELPQVEQAPDVHLSGAWNARRAVEATPRAAETFVEMLEENVQLWPASKASQSARIWLAQVHESRRQWSEALPLFQAIPSDSTHFATAVEGVVRCSFKQLEALPEDSRTALGQTTVDYLNSVIFNANGQLPQRWSEAARTALLASCEIQLQYLGQDPRQVERLLQASLQGSPRPADQWQADATTLLLMAIAAQPGRQQDANRLIASIQDSSPERILSLLRSLDQLSITASPTLQQAYARLALDVLRASSSAIQSLSPADRVELKAIEAWARLRQGDSAQAISMFRQLAGAHPNQAEIQQGFARLLTAVGTPDALQQAIDQWRKVGSRVARDSDSWYEARYQLAYCQLRKGDRQAAAKLLKYVQAVSQVQQSEWASRYAALLEQCR